MAAALDWANLLTRWFHIVAGIAWIGSSFFFIWLDRHLTAPPPGAQRVEGELWMVHSGGFYRMQKYLIGAGQVPSVLHWVKWEATLTWISGITLLAIVYYLTGGVYLVDTNVAAITTAAAIAFSIGVLVGGWILYEAIWRSPFARRSWIASLLSLAALGGIVFWLFNTLSGRAAFIHVGALLGTIMVANVWVVILPSQQRMVAAAARGEEPDFSEGGKAKIRSVHNSYLTFPVIFTMVSSHYPQTYSGEYGWVVLVLLSVAGATARHAMIGGSVLGFRKEWALAPMVAGLVAAFVIATPKGVVSPAPSEGSSASFAEVRVVVATRCASCHSLSPTDAIFRAPPNGIVFDTPQQIKGLSARILERAVVQRTMPFANQSGMTDAERELLRRWIEAGSPLR